jgi:hypothetical protein
MERIERRRLTARWRPLTPSPHSEQVNAITEVSPAADSNRRRFRQPWALVSKITDAGEFWSHGFLLLV